MFHGMIWSKHSKSKWEISPHMEANFFQIALIAPYMELDGFQIALTLRSIGLIDQQKVSGSCRGAPSGKSAICLA
jgi:hypothetical protein